MIPLRAYAGRRVSVLSLTGAGLSTARALAAGGAEVTVWDHDEGRIARARALGLSVEDPTVRDWSDLAAVVVGDPALLEEEPAPRLIDMARALDLPITPAEDMLAQAYVQSEAHFTAALGRQAPSALDFAAYLLRQAGRAVSCADAGAAPRDPAPGAVLLAAFETAPVHAPRALMLLDGAGAPGEVRALVERCEGPVVLSADDPAVRRLSLSQVRRPCLVSARSALSRGVFVAAGRLFDAMDGRARQVADLSRVCPDALAHPLALAAGYALARGLGLTFEAAREGLHGYAGCPGFGAALGRIGPIILADWSAATEPRAVIDALSQTRPVVWLGGTSADPKLAALLEASAKAPSAAVLTGDRRRARRKLARLCELHVERDPVSALALAVHCAMKAGEGACIIYAPAGPFHAEDTARLEAGLDNLVRRARQGDAA